MDVLTGLEEPTGPPRATGEPLVARDTTRLNIPDNVFEQEDPPKTRGRQSSTIDPAAAALLEQDTPWLDNLPVDEDRLDRLVRSRLRLSNIDAGEDVRSEFPEDYRRAKLELAVREYWGANKVDEFIDVYSSALESPDELDDQTAKQLDAVRDLYSGMFSFYGEKKEETEGVVENAAQGLTEGVIRRPVESLTELASGIVPGAEDVADRNALTREAMGGSYYDPDSIAGQASEVVGNLLPTALALYAGGGIPATLAAGYQSLQAAGAGRRTYKDRVRELGVEEDPLIEAATAIGFGSVAYLSEYIPLRFLDNLAQKQADALLLKVGEKTLTKALATKEGAKALAKYSTYTGLTEGVEEGVEDGFGQLMEISLDPNKGFIDSSIEEVLEEINVEQIIESAAIGAAAGTLLGPVGIAGQVNRRRARRERAEVPASEVPAPEPTPVAPIDEAFEAVGVEQPPAPPAFSLAAEYAKRGGKQIDVETEEQFGTKQGLLSRIIETEREKAKAAGDFEGLNQLTVEPEVYFAAKVAESTEDSDKAYYQELTNRIEELKNLPADQLRIEEFLTPKDREDILVQIEQTGDVTIAEDSTVDEVRAVEDFVKQQGFILGQREGDRAPVVSVAEFRSGLGTNDTQEIEQRLSQEEDVVRQRLYQAVLNDINNERNQEPSGQTQTEPQTQDTEESASGETGNVSSVTLPVLRQESVSRTFRPDKITLVPSEATWNVGDEVEIDVDKYPKKATIKALRKDSKGRDFAVLEGNGQQFSLYLKEGNDVFVLPAVKENLVTDVDKLASRNPAQTQDSEESNVEIQEVVIPSEPTTISFRDSNGVVKSGIVEGKNDQGTQLQVRVEGEPVVSNVPVSSVLPQDRSKITKTTPVKRTQQDIQTRLEQDDRLNQTVSGDVGFTDSRPELTLHTTGVPTKLSFESVERDYRAILDPDQRRTVRQHLSRFFGFPRDSKGVQGNTSLDASGVGVGKTRMQIIVAREIFLHPSNEEESNPVLIVTENEEIIQGYKDEAEKLANTLLLSGGNPAVAESIRRLDGIVLVKYKDFVTIRKREQEYDLMQDRIQRENNGENLNLSEKEEKKLTRFKKDFLNTSKAGYVSRGGYTYVFGIDYSGVLLDEAHNVGNPFTQQGLEVNRVIDQTLTSNGKVALYTATPYESALAATDVVARLLGITREQAATRLGYPTRIADPNEDIKQIPTTDFNVKAMARTMAALEVQGAFVSQSYPFWGSLEVTELEMTTEQKAQYDKIVNFHLQGRPLEDLSTRAFENYWGDVKRFVETLKAQQTLDKIVASIEANPNQRVVVFAEQYNPAKIMGKENYADSVIAQIEKGLRERGITFVDLHGGAKGNKKKKIDLFLSNSEDAQVAIATYGGAGTGVNLDDRDGDYPRKIIMVSLPDSAITIAQAMGRVSRHSTESASTVDVLLFPEAFTDKAKTLLLKKKARTLDASVANDTNEELREKIEGVRFAIQPENKVTKIKSSIAGTITLIKERMYGTKQADLVAIKELIQNSVDAVREVHKNTSRTPQDQSDFVYKPGYGHNEETQDINLATTLVDNYQGVIRKYAWRDKYEVMIKDAKRETRTSRGDIATLEEAKVALFELAKSNNLLPIIPNGKIKVKYDKSVGSGVITVADNGVGMTDDILENAFFSILSSQKGEGSSGGYGSAKIAIFGSAEEMKVVTIAKYPDGKKYRLDLFTTTETIFGEGDIPYTKTEVPADTKTGTQVQLFVSPDIDKAKNWNITNYLEKMLSWSDMVVDADYSIVDETGLVQNVTPSWDKRDMQTNPSFTYEFSYPAGKVKAKIFESSETIENYRTNIHVANNGMYTFNIQAGIFRIGEDPYDDKILPKNVFLSIETDIDPKRDGYPFNFDRSALLEELQEKVLKDWKKKWRDINDQEGLDRYAKAFETAEPITGSQDLKVFTYNYKPESLKFIKQVANSPWTQKISKTIEEAYYEFYNLVEASGLLPTPSDGSGKFLGFHMFGRFYGVNVKFDQIKEVAMNERGIFLNPMATIYMLQDRLKDKNFSKEQKRRIIVADILSTTAHELAHMYNFTHNADYASVLTRFLGVLSDPLNRYTNQIINNLTNEDWTEAETFADQWNARSFGDGDNIFGDNATGSYVLQPDGSIADSPQERRREGAEPEPSVREIPTNAPISTPIRTDNEGTRRRLKEEQEYQEDRRNYIEDVKRRLTRFAGKFTNGRLPEIVIVNTTDELLENYEHVYKAMVGATKGKKLTIPAAYDPSTDTILFVAENFNGTASPEAIMAHELVGHFGVRGVLGPEYAQVMLDMYYTYQGDSRLIKIANDHYNLDLASERGKITAMEELIAHIAQQREEERSTKDKISLTSILNKLRELFSRVLGLDQQDADIIELLQMSEAYVSATPLSVATAGNEGNLMTAAEMWAKMGINSPFFKKWFGNSVVLDHNGLPMVQYHGTASDFGEFRRGRLGFHFGTIRSAEERINSIDVSERVRLEGDLPSRPRIGLLLEEYSQQLRDIIGEDVDVVREAYDLRISSPDPNVKELANIVFALDGVNKRYLGIDKNDIPKVVRDLIDAGIIPGRYIRPLTNIMPVYLKIENPVRVPDLFDRSSDWVQDIANSLFTRDKITSDEFKQVFRAPDEKVQQDVLKKILQAHGYDGFVYVNEIEGRGDDSWVAFEPDQIKSATGNNGRFTSGEAHINFAIEEDHIQDRELKAQETLDALGPILSVQTKQVIRNYVEQNGAEFASTRVIGFDPSLTQMVQEYANAYEEELLARQRELDDNAPLFAILNAAHSAPTAQTRNQRKKKYAPKAKASFKDGKINDVRRAVFTSNTRRLYLKAKSIGNPAVEDAMIYLADLLGLPPDLRDNTKDNYSINYHKEAAKFNKKRHDVVESIDKKLKSLGFKSNVIGTAPQGKSMTDGYRTLNNIVRGDRFNDPNLTATEKALIPEAIKLRGFLNDFLQYQIDAGVLTKSHAIPGYLMRMYDPAKVLEKQDEFAKLISDSLVRVTKGTIDPAIADAYGEKVVEKIIHGGDPVDLHFDTSTKTIQGDVYFDQILGTVTKALRGAKVTLPGSMKSRKLWFVDDAEMSALGVLRDDTPALLAEYTANTVKYTEFAKKFGTNYEVLQDVVKTVMNSDLSVNEKTEIAQLLVKSVRAVTGSLDLEFFRNGDRKTRENIKKSIDVSRSISAWAALSFAGFSASVEFGFPLLIYGRDALSSYHKGAFALIQNAFRDDPQGLMRFVEDMNLAFDTVSIQTELTLGSETTGLNQKLTAANSFYHKYISLLAPITHVQRVITAAAVRNRLERITTKNYDALQGEDLNFMKRIGWGGNAQEFAYFSDAFKRYNKGDAVTDQEFNNLNTAILFATTETVVQSSATNRPVWGSSKNPMWQMMYQLQSYSDAVRNGPMAILFDELRDKNMWMLLRFIPLLFIAMWQSAARDAMAELAMDGEQRARKRRREREQSDLAKAYNAIQYTGVLGNAERFTRPIQSVGVYGADPGNAIIGLTGSNILELFGGAAEGMISGNWNSMSYAVSKATPKAPVIGKYQEQFIKNQIQEFGRSDPRNRPNQR